MRALSLYLPTLPADLARLRRRLDPRRPVLLLAVDHGREVVTACCRVAADGGVAPGMTLAHARAVLSANTGAIHTEPFDPARLRRALQRLAVRMTRLAPAVAIDPPDGLLMDVSGCEGLYGTAAALVERVTRGVRTLSLSVRVAAAPTFGGAWALARFARTDSLVVDAAGLAGALADLPIAALRIDEGAADTLRTVGVERVRDVLALPREALAARFGAGLLTRVDRALGRVRESIDPVRPAEPVEASIDFDGPTDRPESIRAAAHELLRAVVGSLARKGRGCRGVDLVLARPGMEPERVSVRTARPTRDAPHLWRLLLPLLERADLGEEGVGVEGITVRARGVVRLPAEQRTAWADHDAARDADVGRLVDVLASRLGRGGVLRARPVESHLPERAFVLEPPDEPRTSGPTPAVTPADRPSLLYDDPLPIDAMLLAPDGPVVAVRLAGRGEGVMRPVVESIGPERIEPEWWRGEGRGARDYFKALIDDGRCLWVFRDPGSGRWFLHGEWA